MIFRWSWSAGAHGPPTTKKMFAGTRLLQGFSGLIPSKIKSRPQCCDDDAMVIVGCMATLNKKNPDAHDLLVDYYLFGKTFMALAHQHSCSDGHIGKLLQKAEGIVEGLLMALDVRLEMDRLVRTDREPKKVA